MVVVPGALDNSPIFHFMQFISSIGLLHSAPCFARRRLLGIHLKYDEDVVPLRQVTLSVVVAVIIVLVRSHNLQLPLSCLVGRLIIGHPQKMFRMFDRVKSLHYYRDASTREIRDEDESKDGFSGHVIAMEMYFLPTHKTIQLPSRFNNSSSSPSIASTSRFNSSPSLPERQACPDRRSFTRQYSHNCVSNRAYSNIPI